jgi:hypothetical protein
MNPFFLTTEKVGPLELRPWTFTTKEAIEALAECNFSESEQVTAIAWMQSRDPDEVIDAIANKTAEKEIRALKKRFPLALAKAVSDWCDRQRASIDSGQIEIIPRTDGRDDGPGN